MAPLRRRVLTAALATFLLAIAAGWAARAASNLRSDLQFTVGEGALLAALRAATPQTITVGSSIASADLVLSDPTDLVLAEGAATFKVRVRGRVLPVDQILKPTVRIDYDRSRDRYYGVVSSLPLQVPGLGTIDLKDQIPRLEIPSILEDLWRFSDRPVGLNLRVRRLAILDHVLEVGADVMFAPVAARGAQAPR